MPIVSPSNIVKDLSSIIRDGISNRKISKMLICDDKTIRLPISGYESTGCVHDMPRSGRLTTITATEDHALKMANLRKRFKLHRADSESVSTC